MKTTSGKTAAPRKEARAVHIYSEGHRGLIAVRKASSLKQALEEYFKDVLATQGFTGKKIVGNTLTVKTKQGGTKLYVALETYQTHLVS